MGDFIIRDKRFRVFRQSLLFNLLIVLSFQINFISMFLDGLNRLVIVS